MYEKGAMFNARAKSSGEFEAGKFRKGCFKFYLFYIYTCNISV